MTTTTAPQTLPPPTTGAPRDPSTDLDGRGRRPVWERAVRGPDTDPAWARPTLLGLLAATAVLYIWGLGSSGWANSFYSAAVQAGSVSWKALFFGSSDAANSITVDKTPASLWVMALSARVFGVNTWSILVPQAIEGVATVGLLYAAVKRVSGPAAGLIAGAVLAVTPVAVLMFRFNNPDALLVLLLVAGAYAVTRALETASTKWLLWAGAFVGLGFLTKMLQALLVVPAFALVYLVAAPTPVRRRIVQLLAAGGALVVAAGWWIAIVSLVPASARPYIGGSQNNGILELTLGYNGFGRLTGNETGSVGGGGPGGGTGGSMWGATGWTRMFGTDVGGQIAWLLPASLILLAAGLWLTRRAPRTDRTRASLLLWGGWLLVTGLVFSFMQGIFHEYYTVALAPAIGAVVGIGATLLWRRRHELLASALLGLTLAVTALWAHTLLGRAGTWHPWIATWVAVAGMAVAVLLVGNAWLPRKAALAVGGAALVVALAAPTAYAVSTAATPHTGSIVTAGPAVASGRFGPGGGPGGGFRGGFGGPPGTAQQGTGTTGQTGGFGGPPGGGGGLLNGSTASAELVALLKADASSYTWAGAAVGSNNASGYQLASGEPVMAIGGFNGSDPSPTLAQFQALVAAGKVHYFLGGGIGMGNQMGGSSSSQEIAAWVTANFTAQTVGGTTVYDLTSGGTGNGSTT